MGNSKFDKNKFLNLKENNFLGKLEDIFNECIDDHLVSDVPIGGLLSGGLELIVTYVSN